MTLYRVIFACGAQNTWPCLLIIVVLSLDVCCLIGRAGIAEETLLLTSVRAWSGLKASQRKESAAGVPGVQLGKTSFNSKFISH